MNAWGIASGPSAPFWVADNGTGKVTLYDQNGAIQNLVVTVPPPAGSMATAAPTGQVFNGNAADFMGDQFIFSTEDGTISGWQSGTAAVLRVDNSTTTPSAVYKGLALATNAGANFIYATNFRAGTVDVFDHNYAPVTLPAGAFADATLPAGFAPFGIATVTGNLFVTYALQDAAKHDDVKAAGNGYVNVFTPAGALVMRFASQGALNSPWAVVLAPVDFGTLAGSVLVGNFGDGAINAFDPTNGTARGPLSTPAGSPITIDGLWGLAFGNDAAAGPHDRLYYTAGPMNETHGAFGEIDHTP